MKKITFRSIQSKLTFWFLTLTLLPLIVVLFITYFQRVEVIRFNSFDKLTAIRDLKVQRLQAWLEERVGDMNTFSLDSEIAELEQIKGNGSFSMYENQILGNCRLLLKRYLENYDAYARLYIINPRDGKVIVSTDPSMEGADMSANEYFLLAQKNRKLNIKDVYYSKELSELTMDYYIPVFCAQHHKEHVVGVLVANINLKQSLYRLLSERVGLGSSGETLIVNDDVLALSELRWFENAPLNLEISAEPAVKAARGETGIVITNDYCNRKVLAAYTHIPETKWGFVCKQDILELNAPIRKMVANFIVLFLVSASVISLVAIGISRSISKPIVKLDKVAQKMTAGDFSLKNDIATQDELGSLAKAFNEMAESIQSKLFIQDGVFHVSKVMIGRDNMKKYARGLLQVLMKLTDAQMSTFYVLDEEKKEYTLYTSVGANEKLLNPFKLDFPEGEFGNVFSNKEIYHLKELKDDTLFTFRTTAGDIIPKEIISIPVLVEQEIIAVISLVTVHDFSKEALEIIKNTWSHINASYSSILSNDKRRILTEKLTASNTELEQKTIELEEKSEELLKQTEELQRNSEELQEQNLELEAQRKQIEAANNLKSEFLSNMSHELRTPLNSIMALSSVLLMEAKDRLSEEESGYLEIIERNGKRLLKLINDILDLSKIEAGRLEVVLQQTSVTVLLNTVKETLWVLAQEKGLEMILDVEPDLPMVKTDESKLHQVLTNIVGNAIKFTETGSVKIKAFKYGGKVKVKVTDTGIGISEEMLPYIFDEFRQVDGTSSRKFEGTGLGLAIANKLMNVLGGSIYVESEPGKGSVFTISFPVVWHNEFASQYERIDVEDVKNNSGNELAVPSGAKILLVEDHPEAILQLKSVLERQHYIVDVATGGKEALEYIHHNIPDGIILDLMMPEIDGFEVLEKLKVTERTKNIPVLILTAKDLNRKDLKRLSSNNVQQLVQKGGIDIDGLLTKVKLMLRNNSDTRNIVDGLTN